MIVRSEALLHQGDARVAGGLAAEAIAISQRHGMKLRRVRATVLYGQILFARNKRQIARSVIERARDDAERMRYQSKAARAQAILTHMAFATPATPLSWGPSSER